LIHAAILGMGRKFRAPDLHLRIQGTGIVPSRFVDRKEKPTIFSKGMTRTKNEMLFANPAACKLLNPLGVKTFQNIGIRNARA
jgi:hypothetical protein